jgi:hypothetical protein
MTKKQIETRIRALLEIKRIRKGLTPDEESTLKSLEKKYRDLRGRLIKGCYYINSQGQWAITC